MVQDLRKAASSVLIFAALAAPPVFFYAVVFKYAVNVPIWDDYAAILDFLLRYQDADGALSRLRMLFAQHNEHRIAFGNLSTVVMYEISGQVDFRTMIFFGNAALLGLVTVFCLLFREDGRKALYFIPVVLFLFHLQFYDAAMWAMASVSNFYVLFFSFGSILLLRKDGRFFFALAFFLAALASVTQGSGIFALAACALFLFLKRDFRGLALWCALSGAVLALYFVNYVKPAHHPSVMEAVFSAPLNTLRYFFTFTGASFPVPLLAGLIFSFLFLFLTWKGYHRKNPALYCALAYVFLTAAVTALTRSGFGIEQALSQRYRIVSALFPMLIYMAFSEFLQGSRLKARVFFPAVLAGALVFNLYVNITGLKEVRIQNIVPREGLARWDAGLNGLLYPDDATANRIMVKSIARGLYKPDYR